MLFQDRKVPCANGPSDVSRHCVKTFLAREHALTAFSKSSAAGNRSNAGRAQSSKSSRHRALREYNSLNSSAVRGDSVVSPIASVSQENFSLSFEMACAIAWAVMPDRLFREPCAWCLGLVQFPQPCRADRPTRACNECRCRVFSCNFGLGDPAIRRLAMLTVKDTPYGIFEIPP